MSNKSNNGTNKVASNNKGRRGPRPIVTVGMLREKLLKEMMVKELKKIDRKMLKLIRREGQLHDKILTTQQALANLKTIREEYATEVKA
jgi:DNA-binding protein